MENPTPTHKTIIQLIAKTGAIGILAYIIIFFGGQYMQKMTMMQKDLIQIRIELTKIQATLLSKDDIQDMINSKMNYHEAKYHNQ